MKTNVTNSNKVSHKAYALNVKMTCLMALIAFQFNLYAKAQDSKNDLTGEKTSAIKELVKEVPEFNQVLENWMLNIKSYSEPKINEDRKTNILSINEYEIQLENWMTDLSMYKENNSLNNVESIVKTEKWMTDLVSFSSFVYQTNK